MSFLDGLLNQTVLYEEKVGENEAVESVYASPVTLPAYVDYSTSNVTGTNGNAFTSQTQVWLATIVGSGCRITLPTPDGSGYEPRGWIEGRIEGLTDLDGSSIGCKVFL